MKLIALRHAYKEPDVFTKVDDDIYEKYGNCSWAITRNGYVSGTLKPRFSRTKHGVRHERALLHRLVMDAPNDMEVDHINGDRLDNRRENLRLCTRKQNAKNRRKSKNNTSGYRGVAWQKPAGKWQAYVIVDDKHVHLGLFTDKVEAAKAHDLAAKKYHGAFASLNFPDN